MSKKPIIALVVFAGLILLAAYFFTDIFTYFLISMVLATMMKPIINFVSTKFRLPKGPSILIAVVFLMSFFVLLGSQFVPLIKDQINLLSSINIDRMLNLVEAPVISVHDWLKETNIISEEEGTFQDTIKSYVLDLVSGINVKAIFNTIFSVTGSVFVSVLALSFITFFLAYTPGMVKNQLLKLVPNQYFEITISTMNKIEFLLGRYFRGIIMQMASIFTLVGLGLTIAGVKYAITIALFAALINLIPYIGPLVGASFGIIIGLTTAQCAIGSPEFYWLLTKIGIVFGFVQIMDNVVLQPIIFSKSLKAHPLEIFVIIFAGANLGGTIGMVVAIPLYTIIKVSVTELARGYKQYKVFKI